MEWLKPSEGPTLRSWVRHMFISARTLLASTLPSSTPHWSKLLMPQMKPCRASQEFYTLQDSTPVLQLGISKFCRIECSDDA